MTARPLLVLIGLAAVWTAGVWASPVMPLPPLSAVPQDPGAEAAPSSASAPSPRSRSGADRPSLLPAPRLDGTEAAGRPAPEAAPLLPSPPSMTTQAAEPDAPALSPSAGRETGEPGLFPARRSGTTETAGRPAPQPASPLSVETRSAGTDGLTPSLLPSPSAAGEADVAGPVPPDGKPAAASAQSGGSRDAGTRSRLLRSLERRPMPRPESAPPPGPSGPAAGGDARRRAVFGCPREVLTALLAGAAEPGGAVSALAVEREVLLLCRERQSVVAEIVRLEGELSAALDASKPPSAKTAGGSGDGGVEPRRVVLRLAAPEPSEERAAPAPKAAAPKPPAYAWFSILGTPGRLRAGVSDGRRVWFVREGDRLPGAVRIERITARPPGVRVQGAGHGALPYGARPAGEGT